MPRGGRRPGAGRPPGTGHPIDKTFPIGFVKATKIMNKTMKAPEGYRVPADSSPAAREAADYAFQRYVDVAAGRVHSRRATSVLKAAIEIRREVCGPIATKVDVDVKGRLEMLLGESMRPALDVTPERPQITERAESGDPALPRPSDGETG